MKQAVSSNLAYMNPTDTNSGGWEGCARRTWCNNVYKNALPSTFVGLLKQHENITASGGGDCPAVASIDYVALPAEKEVYGTVERANAEIEELSIQFEYYVNDNNNISKGTNYWLRSPVKIKTQSTPSTDSFVSAWRPASRSSVLASKTQGIAPFFCI